MAPNTVVCIEMLFSFPNNNVLSVQIVGVMGQRVQQVGLANLRSRGGGFHSQWGRGCVTTVGKLFTPLYRIIKQCNSALTIMAGDDLRLGR